MIAKIPLEVFRLLPGYDGSLLVWSCSSGTWWVFSEWSLFSLIDAPRVEIQGKLF